MNDKDMVPVAGHVLRVQAPWVGNVLIDSRSNNNNVPFFGVCFHRQVLVVNTDDSRPPGKTLGPT